VTTKLYFAYTAHLAPERLAAVTPQAEFLFIAHLPETKLVFPLKDGQWDGGLPSVQRQSGNTVWGAVFEIPDAAIGSLHDAEMTERRVPSDAFKAVDREGRSHRVITHVHGEGEDEHPPSRAYMAIVVAGARHWGLPTGWVAGLEEYVEEPLF
jgi:cation transport regulator ChaC